MLTVGDKFPPFALKATVSEQLDTAFETITNDSYRGKWLVVFFWPKDFTFVCPTEIAEFGRKNGDFTDRDAQVLGASVDSEFVHLAWRKDHKDLTGLPFPMLADIRKDLSSALGVLDEEGVAKRATLASGTSKLVSVMPSGVKIRSRRNASKILISTPASRGRAGIAKSPGMRVSLIALRVSNSSSVNSSSTDGSPSFRSMPSDDVRFACGSRSIARTFRPRCASAPARLKVVVVFPTPPFWFTTAIRRRCAPVAIRTIRRASSKS